MKILLVGEYSRLHNSLKEGLILLGHEVKIIASGDGFKKYNVDYCIDAKLFSNYYLTKKMSKIILKLFGHDLQKTERAIRFYFFLPKLKDFDHVQLINSDAIEIYPLWELWMFKKLFSQNKKMSLLVCGDETPVVDYLLKEELPYSVLTPFLKDKSKEKAFQYIIKYTHPNYRKLFNWIQKNAFVLIVSDLDYKIPMEKMNYKVHFIPNPVNVDKINFKEKAIPNKVIIFLGINKLSYEKKGIHFFEKALQIIEQKYAKKVTIVISENLRYDQYINFYNSAHIVLDQTYSLDQGYNALEAMAKGKVVFTGAEKEFEAYYNLTEKVAIHALPGVDYLVTELSFLIENPIEIIKIGKNARLFIEAEHHYLNIAKKYIEIWNNPLNR